MEDKDRVYYKKNVINLNPRNSIVKYGDPKYVVFHEVAHAIDVTSVVSPSNRAFSSLIKAYENNYTNQLIAYQKYKELGGDKEGAISDIIDALTKGTLSPSDGIFRGHSAEYWEQKGAQELEVFAEVSALVGANMKEDILFIQENFTDIYDAVMGMYRGRK